MIRFLLIRLAQIVPTIIGVTLIAFAFIRLVPGDPIEVLSGERGVSPERHAALMAKFGFDLPLHEQYLNYLWQILHGDLGNSLVTRQPVLEEFAILFPATLELSLAAMLFALALGIPAGIIAALRRGTAADHILMGGALTGYSMPIFWWGLLLILLFSGVLQWTPVSGRISVLHYVPPVTGFLLIDCLLAGDFAALRSALRHLILPAVALGTIPLAVLARQTRSAMLEVLGEDYIRAARAKGLAPWRVILLHALRNAMIPVLTTIGLQVGVLLAGAILTETIFAWPGVGHWLVNSIFRRDYPSVQGGLLLIALCIMAVNLLVDVLYGLADPRIRHSRQ